MSSLSRAHLFALGGLVAGCTTILGIEDDYSAREQAVAGATGGTRPSTGGSAGLGGSTGATGGLGGSGGGGASGGTSNPCAADEKQCTFQTDGGAIQQCVKPAALVGCSPTDCTRCPGATNADPICNGEQCSLKCIPGYEFSETGSGSCVPMPGTGGTGGSGGAGGSGGSTSTGGSGGTPACDPLKCGMCNPAGPFRCCKLDHTCGCTWAPGAVCY